MNEWVEFYERRDGLQESHLVRRRRHLDRVLVADVEGDGERQRADQVPDQRAGRRARRSRRSTSTSSSIAGPGVQHLALATDDIIATVTALRDRGVEFLQVPTTYYDELQERVGKIDEPIDAARGARHPRRSRSGRLPAADLHEAGRGSADALLRDHPAKGREELRQGELQGAVRSDRAGAGAARESL